jgi:hypothetical protein
MRNDKQDAGAKQDSGEPTGSQSDAGTDAAMDPPRPPMTAIARAADCPVPSGDGTMHSSDIVGEETWTAAQSPHYITRTLSVKGTLTIEACSKVILSKGVSLYVGSSSDAGRLIARGVYEPATERTDEVAKPVIFSSASADEYWGMVFVNGLGEAELDATVFIQGGDLNAISTSAGGTLVARGPNDGSLRRMIASNIVVIIDSASFGVTLESGAGFKGGPRSELIVSGAGRLPKPQGYNASIDPRYPVFVEPPGVGTLPPGNYYGSTEPELADNDKIFVAPRAAITVDEQFHDRGVPYLMRYDFYMRPATTSVLTIDPGVQLRFFREQTSSARYRMTIGDCASIDPRPVALDIQGTADNSIVFTSDAQDPVAGDWVGLYLDCSPKSGNKLSHAVVAYAGASSQTNGYGCGPKSNDAAIIITGWRPDDAFIQDVAIGASAASGIVSGWTSDSAGPDLKTGNLFEQIADGCNVSRWKNATGLACPERTDEAPLCL